MSILVCYAPANDSPEERKDEYYEELQGLIDEIPGRNLKIVIGDFNAKVGWNNQGIENAMGVDCLSKDANEDRAHFTRTSSCGNYKNQMDHIAIIKEIRSILRNVRNNKGADIGSDPQLIIATLKFKLKAPNRNMDRRPRFDTIKLLEVEDRDTFLIECRNRFSVLDTYRDEEPTNKEKWRANEYIYQ
ncbi:craniofacial development protein 2-like [Palaemon carinicauda]|uniref:craniofacial development protein 2-like n=1 Tax=Palaemon carinicauda TaxID=392227 RepID=UPI0035B6ABBE